MTNTISERGYKIADLGENADVVTSGVNSCPTTPAFSHALYCKINPAIKVVHLSEMTDGGRMCFTYSLEDECIEEENAGVNFRVAGNDRVLSSI